MSADPRIEPLKVRPGARFSCTLDGLCCSDIHAIGPLDEQDCDLISAISEDAIEKHHADNEPVLLMRKDTGTCVFLSEQGCLLHAKLGSEFKPTPCRRFPFGLTATPEGGRINTRHRCSCRTLGARPELTVDSSRSSLVDREGRVRADHAVGDILWSADRKLSFTEYEALESELLHTLVAGTHLREALGTAPFPKLQKQSWTDVATTLTSYEGDSAVEIAAAWVGDAIMALVERGSKADRKRPWAGSFERARERVVEPEHPNLIFGDWFADELWSLRWTQWGSLTRARSEWATRLALVRKITAWLMEEGHREDLAAAEAVTIVDIVTHSDAWDSVQEEIPDA